MKTIKRSQLSSIRMVGGGEKTTNYVILGGQLKHWVGIGWVTQRKATAADAEKYPTVVEG